MFVIMAVNAQIFPIRPVRRIIHVIPIFMVHRQEMPRFLIELSSTLGADETIYLE